MRLNSKLTWGLAWAGLAVVLIVPSADYLTGQFGAKARTTALLTSTTDPVKPAGTSAADTVAPTKAASVTTRVTKTGVTIVPNAPAAATEVAASGAPTLDPVDKLLKSGKKLPDYISGGDSAAVPAPTTTTTAPGAKPASGETTQVATVDPATIVAPVPFPRRPPDVVRPALPRATTPAQPTVIVDEQALATQRATPVMPDELDVDAGPVPPAGIADDWRTARERRLSRYLEQNGLVDDASVDGRSSASVTVVQRPSSNYDPDGFYLSDGPNNSRAARRARIERMLQDEDDQESGFTLF
jgi:hypothetical protein